MIKDLAQEILEHWLDAEGHRGVDIGGRRQEVGDAGDDQDVALLLHRGERLGQNLKAAARQVLSSRHHWTIATVGGVQVTPEVRIPDQSEDTGLGHFRQVLAI